MITDVVIMAGGTGERLWPASTPLHPKQFFLLNDNLSFLQSSLLRALSLDITGKIIIVTRRNLIDECTRQCLELSKSLSSPVSAEKILKDTIVIGESESRHTLAALLTAVTYLNMTSGFENHTILTVTSDHIIENMVAFIKDAETAAVKAEEGALVVFGVKPEYASSEYGYIKKEACFSGSISRVRRFIQKPDLKKAAVFTKNKDYFWNSGMLCFTSNFFMRSTLMQTPKVFARYNSVKKGPAPKCVKLNSIQAVVSWPALDEIYTRLPRIDVDKAITEKVRNVWVVPAHFAWADIGTWDSFSSKIQLKQTEKVVQVEAQNNLVYTDIPVVLCGIDDLIVVQKEGKLLIMKKQKSALLKTGVEEFENSGDPS